MIDTVKDHSFWEYLDEEGHSKDIRFSSHFMLKQGGDEVAAMVLELLDHQVSRKTKRGEIARRNMLLTIESVVANALRGAQWTERKSVYYYRRPAEYPSIDVYSADWLGIRNLLTATNGLTELGFLTASIGGAKGQYSPYKKFPQSTFRATDELLTLLAELGFQPEDVRRSSNAPVLYLKQGNEKLQYDPNEAVPQKLAASVRTYNEFVNRFALGLNSARLDHLDANDREKAAKINFAERVLWRGFTEGSWERGGRWWGGWWQNCPSKVRELITIDGEQTVECDYSGFSIRALYHHNNVNCLGDPYDITDITKIAEKRKMNMPKVRDSLKTLVLIHLYAAEHHKMDKVAGLHLPAGIKPADVYRSIEAQHQPIAHHFRSGIANQVMSWESTLCGQILQAGIERGILVLPVHDSYLVMRRYGGWLKSVMASRYRQMFGFPATIH